LARGELGLEEAQRECEVLGDTALAIPTDVADPDQVERAAETVELELGPIDVWVNDAMATIFAPFAEVTPADYKRATEVTYLGTVHGTMSALRRMQPRNRGTIVQVGSALAYRAIPLQSVYCGAKFGIRGFSDSLRTELLHDRSRVWITMVQLPAVNTPQFNWCRSTLPKHPQPVPPIYQPEVPAESVYFAAHHRRREVVCGGSAAVVIWANKFAPGIADRYLARTGFGSQQIENLPVTQGRPDNLYHPVPDLAATHGMFDESAKARSYQAWASQHRVLVSAGALAVAAVLTRAARSGS
jgi:short-subunit dehydrogenase